MTGLDERLKDDGRRLLERAQAIADTEDALAELNDEIEVPITGGGRRAFARIAAAALLAIVGVATFAVARRSPTESVSFGLPLLSAAAPTVTTMLPLPDPTQVLPTLPTITTAAHPNTTQPTTTAGSTPVTTGQQFPPQRPCTYTDPGRWAITVARALKCPDGTRVWVRGYVVTATDGTRYLCGGVSADDATPCDGLGLKLVGDARGEGGEFTGTKQGSELLLSAQQRPSGFRVQFHEMG